MDFISHYIMPLVNSSLGGRHTHADIMDINNFKKPGMC